VEPFLFYGGNGFVEGEADRDTGKDWTLTPVGVAISQCAIGSKKLKDCVFVSSDGTGSIVAVAYVSKGGEGEY
jgi:hypothetical protein